MHKNPSKTFKKPCRRCNEMFQPSGKTAKYCENCKKPSGYPASKKKYKSELAEAELRIRDLLKGYETLISTTFLTIADAEKMLVAGDKILMQCERLRLGRDKWKNKYYDLKNGK